MSAALEEDKFHEVWEEVSLIENVVREDVQFMAVMLHPATTSEEKREFLTTIFAGKLSDITMGFLNILLEKGRFDQIESILAYFQLQAKEYDNIGVAYVTTAVELTGRQRQKIEDKLLELTKYESFEMQFIVNPELIGGMTIRIGDRVVDDSIRTKLNEMKEGARKA